MVTVIVQSTSIISASGIENLTQQVQASGARNDSSIVEFGPISRTDHIVTPAGIEGSTSSQAFQGPGMSTSAITAKGPGQTGFVYSNVLQNPSFESGLRRWSVVLGNPGDFVVEVSQQPLGVGFDDDNPVTPINGTRMAHIHKFEEPGVVAVLQGVNVTPNVDTNLGEFTFSVCGDTNFRPDTTGTGGSNGKYFDVVLEFFYQGALEYRLNYNLASGQRPPDFPAELLPVDRVIILTYSSADIFQTYTRDLSVDVNQNFSFDSIRVWFIQGQTETLFVDEFDTLLDDVSLTVGYEQVALESTTVEVPFLVFDPDFSRSRNLLGVVGTSGTAEKFFDRSDAFFGFHEADPNTLRDISEAQQFLIFTQTNIGAFDNFRNTVGGVALISAKGDEVSSTSLQPTNIVSNGGFESLLANWQIITSDPLDSISTVTQIPIDPGGIGPLAPYEGSRCLYIVHDGQTSRESTVIMQARKLVVEFDASILNQFSFASVIESTSDTRQGLIALRFLNNSDTKFVIQYRLNGLPGTLPDEISDFDRRIDLNLAAGSWKLSLRNIYEDMNRPAFKFDEIEVWIAHNSSDTNETHAGWDSISLTLNVTNLDLLRTSSFANVFTGHPTASGFPFTISGSDDVTALDLAPPFFDETSPASGTSFNTTDSSVTFHVKDAATALDVGTIDVWIQVNENELNKIVTAGSPELSATYPTISRTDINSRDIRYDVTRSGGFPQQATVIVSGTFADLASPSNGQTQFYDFKLLGSGYLNAAITGLDDTTAPTITPTDPVSLATQISPNTDIVWTTSDDAAGVDPTSLVLTLNGQTSLVADVGQTGTFSRISNANRGFDYQFTPSVPFKFGETVTGTISVSDYADTPNTGNLTYTWDITPDDSLDIINFFMSPGETQLLTSGTLASVEVVDFTHGVSVSGTYLTVNNNIPAGLVTVLSGSGPDRLIFQFALDPLITFREDLNVFVHAENLFPGAYPVIKEQTYILRPGYGVNWPNRNLDTDLPGPETEFPFVTNIEVLTEVKNFAKTFNTGAKFYRFLTENLSRTDLSATIESNVKVADLSAFLNVENPFFEYGKTMTLEVEVTDLEGNQFSFTHVFTIEEDPI